MTPPPLTLNAWLRHDAVRRLLATEPAPRSVLEIGCGLGAMAARMGWSHYVGVEPDPASRSVARKRLPLVLSTLDELESGRTFDLVCAFEVLEHIPDDRAALEEWAARVAPGGALLLSVPAGRDRWGAGDELAGHVRRYDEEELAPLLEAVGLRDVRVVAYGGPLGYALEHARNLLARRTLRRAPSDATARTARSGRLWQPPDRLGSVTAAVSTPFRVLQRPPSARGPGLLALGRRG